MFPRQFGLSVLELKFEDIEQFNFKPVDETTGTVIYDATLITSNGLFYWADFADWKIGDNSSIWMD